MSTSPQNDPPHEGDTGLIIELLSEARAMLSSLQTQITELRQQTWETTRNLEFRIRNQEGVRSVFLYILATVGVVALVFVAVALGFVAVALFRLSEHPLALMRFL